MRDVVALRAVALGVVADEPELVGDTGGQRADLGERDGGGARGAGQFGGASGGAAEGSQGRRVIGQGRHGQAQSDVIERGRAGGGGERLRGSGSSVTTWLAARTAFAKTDQESRYGETQQLVGEMSLWASVRQNASDQQAAVLGLAGNGECRLSVPHAIQQRESVHVIGIGTDRSQDTFESEKLTVEVA